ncbi:hypothetical protein XENOCAPTIV_027651 [Xenoophorus captivus]|uniref:Uncharacterized protein n=1 Tax=Xenoophorus captivus TaxID=1517983 RepID=A0ABV0RDT1_9TELE
MQMRPHQVEKSKGGRTGVGSMDPLLWTARGSNSLTHKHSSELHLNVRCNLLTGDEKGQEKQVYKDLSFSVLSSSPSSLLRWPHIQTSNRLLLHSAYLYLQERAVRDDEAIFKLSQPCLG